MRVLIIFMLMILLLPSTSMACDIPVTGINVALDRLYQEDKLYDIPLSGHLQKYTYVLCKQYDVDFEMVLAVMDVESEYNTKAFRQNKKSYDVGLMQINSFNHSWLIETLGLWDVFHPWNNIKSGVFILSGLSAKYPDKHQVLTAYNMGDSKMRLHWKKGVKSTEYSRKVMRKIEELRKEDNP